MGLNELLDFKSLTHLMPSKPTNLTPVPRSKYSGAKLQRRKLINGTVNGSGWTTQKEEQQVAGQS